MSAITTHILDVSAGVPARGVAVVLEREVEGDWETVGEGATDGDGRLRDLFPAGAVLRAGNYRLVFDTESYFERQRVEGFYPHVTVAFAVRGEGGHYHVPLLLSPFGYSTYRGS